MREKLANGRKLFIAFVHAHPVESIIVALLIAFVSAAIHLIWLAVKFPQAPILTKAFEAFVGFINMLLGGLLLKLRSDKVR